MSKRQTDEVKGDAMESSATVQAEEKGVVLVSRSGEARTLPTVEDWESVLTLAACFGWKPAGTEAPNQRDWRIHKLVLEECEYDGWGGAYLARVGEVVTTRDAAAIGKALEYALAHLFADGGELDRAVIPCFDTQDVDSLVERFGSGLRALLQELSEFCYRGSFAIW